MGFEPLFEPPLFLTGVFLFGLIIGSFLNVVILRLPRRLEYDWRCQCEELLSGEALEEREPAPTLSSPPSCCPNCGHQIKASENIPVISYLLLRGRCSGCGQRISPRYPLIELGTGIAFALVAWQLGPTAQMLGGLLLTAFLISLAGIDYDHQLLPDNLTYPLLWIGLAASLTGVTVDPAASIIGALVGYLSLWGVFQLFRLITGKDGMGHGDFKLMAALGAWMGWEMLPMTILLSSLVGAVVGITLMMLKLQSREQPIPFGPFIAAAGWLAFLWGEDVLQGYLRFSGLA